jgi:AraC-like DNA-binding protein
VAIAALVLRYIFSLLAASARNHRAAPSPRIQRCLDYVAEHPDEPLNVPHLARHVGLSPSRFKARFRAEMGLPPREYVLRQKIQTAEAALKRPRTSVTDVAHALGFSSSQYFATVFRRFTGASPTQRRRSS